MSNIVPLRRTGFPEITIEHGDDGVTMMPDGGAIVDLRPARQRRQQAGDFDTNLAEDMDDGELDYLASQLIDAIDDDERSRSGWLQSYEKAIDLLGVKIEDAPSTGALGLTRSTIRAPILLEACIRFQSNARGELLPADGPVKVRIDERSNEQLRDMADDLQRDLNHYLTVTATEFYPDFDRMLFHVAFAGCAFRKIYEDPLRGRPVSESVYAPDLIVSQDITDLDNATRITHRITMRQSIMRRMQLLGVYRDVDLTAPFRVTNAIDAKIKDNMGLAAWTDRPEDQPYEVLECYCEWDLKGYEHTDSDGPTGLPLPYQITIERTSRKVLAIRRNWRKDDPLMRAVPRFVKYGMGSGLGFYDYGFAHILGNSARTLTAIWRLLIDAGMFANFPGFLMKKGARVGSTQIRVGPGEGKEIETGSADDIRQSIMPLPYKDPSAVLMEFAQHIEENARKLAGMAEIDVGEGKQDAPVGTTIALIEQATKVMAAVHKRLHQAMQQEFRLFQELFARNPRALWAHNKTPARYWQAAQEMNNFDLIPAADPNVASQMERVMKVQGLVQLAQNDPEGYNKVEVRKRALKALGFDDVDSLIAPPAPPGAMPPDPKLQVAQIQAQTKQLELQTNAKLQTDKLQSDRELEKMKLAHDFAESQDRQNDRVSREHIAMLQHATAAMQAGTDHTLGVAKLAFDHAQHLQSLEHEAGKHQSGLEQEQVLHAGGIVAEHMKHSRELELESTQADQSRADERVDANRKYELEGFKLDQQQSQHEDKIAAAKEAAKAKAAQAKKKGIAKYADGGRVVVDDPVPVIHVHPNITIQERAKPKTERLVEFITDASGNITGARIVEKEINRDDNDPEIIVEFDA